MNMEWTSWDWLHALTDRSGHRRRASRGAIGSGPALRQNRFLPLTGERAARDRFRTRGSSPRGRELRPAASSTSRLRTSPAPGCLCRTSQSRSWLVDEARHRAVERLFGVSREQSWQVTLIALALLASAAHDKSDQLLKGPGGPTRSDVMLGAAGLRELLTWIPGPSSRDTPLVGTLVMVALVGAPGPSGREPGRPRHQDLLTPSSALV